MRLVKIWTIFVFVMFFTIFNSDVANALDYVNTDYMHEFKQDINNIVDNNNDTYFVLPDFTNYLEFKLPEGMNIQKIEMIFDSVSNDYEYKIYSSKNGYEYYDVNFTKKVKDDFTETLKLDIMDPFIKIRVLSSKSEDFVNIREIKFFDKSDNQIGVEPVEKEDPVINTKPFKREEVNYKDAIKGLISRTIGEKYVNFFEVHILEDRGYDYFQLSSYGDKIVLKGNNVNSLAVALNHYYEHYLNKTYSRFGDSKINVELPFKPVEGVVERVIDMKYRYNYNYVVYGYTTTYWDFQDWEREIDWMALNGFNMALNLIGHEEVVRKFLSNLGFSFSEIVNYLTSPIYLGWQFMGNITRIGGEMTPKWFEDRMKLSHKVQNRMMDFMIEPVHQTYIGYFPAKQGMDVDILEGGYWSFIKGPSRLKFEGDNYTKVADVFYKYQKEMMGESKYFAGDLFHEGPNVFGYDVKSVSKQILDSLKKNNGEDSIWIIQSWSQSPTSDVIEPLDRKNIIILDLHSQLNTRWKGQSDFNGMSWTEKEFNSSNWIFSILNNFGGRSGMYGHAQYLVDQFYDAKKNAKFLSGFGHTSEAIGDNEFIDELATELIFQDELNFDEFKRRYVRNRYGQEREELLKAFDILIETVYNPTTKVYHEGASESLINARPGRGIKSASKWGMIHKDYDSKLLESALSYFSSVYDDFKHNGEYIKDLVSIASQVLNNIAYDYYLQLEKAHDKGDFNGYKTLSDKFLYIINLQANILYYNKDKSLNNIFDKIEVMGYDDYFEETLKLNKKTLITIWYDKMVSEVDGLRDYGNTDYYELVGNLYYYRWKNYFDSVLSGNISNKKEFDDYRFDSKWIYSEDSLKFIRSKKSLKELVELVIVEFSLDEKKNSLISDLVYTIRSYQI